MTVRELVDREHPFKVKICRLDSPITKGSKKALYVNRMLYVSTAMWSLIEDDDSLESVAQAIEVIEIA